VQDSITSGATVIEVGKPIYTFYLAKSAGVDPATGRQLYYAYMTQTVDDSGQTVNVRCDEYVTDNVTMANLSRYYQGSREPDFFGSIGSSFTLFKNIDLSFLTTYSVGGKVYDGLYNGAMHVQYAGNNWHTNAKRRWQKPGDVVRYKQISLDGSETPQSSRFIMDDNELKLGTLNVGYRFSYEKFKWLNTLNINTLALNFTTNDLFRISTIKMERGLDYPFARTYTLSLSVIFK